MTEECIIRQINDYQLELANEENIPIATIISFQESNRTYIISSPSLDRKEEASLLKSVIEGLMENIIDLTIINNELTNDFKKIMDQSKCYSLTFTSLSPDETSYMYYSNTGSSREDIIANLTNVANKDYATGN